MGNFLSTSDSQELDNLGKYTIPLSALGSIAGGVFLIAIFASLRNLEKRRSKDNVGLSVVTAVNCPAKNFCLVDVQLDDGSGALEAIPVAGMWTISVGDKLWVSFEKDSQGSPMAGTGQVVMEPTPLKKNVNSSKELGIILWIPVVMSIFLILQGVVKLMGGKFGSARKLNSAGFFAAN